ncbi:MAG: hypothetical protein LUF85_02225 [Bacteroides sp.]|nr:hypothetical protein [Bacteroides sp.]
MNNTILFNPDYLMKPDSGRTLIMAKYLGRSLPIPDAFETFIHPMHAMILIFMNGEDTHSCVRKAAEYLHVSEKLIYNFVEKLKNNNSFITVHSKQGPSTFPPNTLISAQTTGDITPYTPEMFVDTHVDLRLKRHLTPSSITLMVNNKCLTNCFYCYADRRKKIDCQIPFPRIQQLIREARELNVRTFDVIGGEFLCIKTGVNC